MNDTLTQYPVLERFVAERLPFTGLAAWCARLPDRTIAGHSYVPWLSMAQLEQIFARITPTLDGLQQDQRQPVRLCWTFEQLRLHLAAWIGGACLVLIVQNTPETSAAAIQAALDEFRRLPA